MSKLARKAFDTKKKGVQSGLSSKTVFNTRIPAQCASAAPPLGPLLGRFGLNIANFCKDFNTKTSVYKKGIPLPITVRIRPDRSYVTEIETPPISYYLKQAAGIERKITGKEVKSGEITLKHIYEIAKIKHTDPFSKYQILELEQVVQHLLGYTKILGLELVKEIDPVKYKEFLDQRKVYLEELDREMEEEKKLKLQRI